MDDALSAFEARLAELRALIASWTEQARERARAGLDLELKRIDDEQRRHAERLRSERHA